MFVPTNDFPLNTPEHTLIIFYMIIINYTLIHIFKLIIIYIILHQCIQIKFNSTFGK